MTLYDTETGLPGRALVLDRLGVATQRSVRTGGTVGLLLIASPSDLTSAGEALREVIRAGDTVARATSAELAVIADDLTSPADAEAIAERALRCLGEATAIGVAIACAERRDPEQMLDEAGRSLVRAQANRGGYELFDPDVRERAQEQARSDAELRSAIASGELLLHYQPIVDTQDGLARGVEALVRWEHPEHGLLGPNDFVPIAEASGAIVPLGDWVLRDACRQMKAWQASHADRKPLWLAVNISRAQLTHPSIMTVVQRALAESGLAPESLYLEVAQADIAGDPNAIAALSQLRTLGVGIAIDDADAAWRDATGDAPVAMVKARPETVQAVLAGIRGEAEVVAQRIEDREDEVRLRERGCHLAQGYLYARPAPAGELDALLSFEQIEDGELVES